MKPGQYRTPKEVAARMAELLELDTRNLHVLDSSCGEGTLLEAAFKGCWTFPVQTSCLFVGVEIDKELYTKARDKFDGPPFNDYCFNIWRGDSLDIPSVDYILTGLSDTYFERIIINPPFFQDGKRVNVDHIHNNYNNLLAVGGIMVALVDIDFPLDTLKIYPRFTVYHTPKHIKDCGDCPDNGIIIKFWK